MVEFIDLPLWLIYLASVVVFIAGAFVGRLCGRRTTAGGPAVPSVATLHSAVLGMLGLMIAFTFAMALTRHEARRASAIEEANAISTAALRARLLPEPHAAESLALLRDYVALRVEISRPTPRRSDLAEQVARSGALQESLWRQAIAVAEVDDRPVPTGAYIAALNVMFDLQTARLAAHFSHIPAVVYLAIYLIGAVSFGFTGYANRVEGHGLRVSTGLMALMIAAVILLIHDLDRPGRGFIRVDRQPMIDVAATIADYRA